MQVKIGNKIYNSDKQPIMVILTDKEKDLIANMTKEAHKFCSYPQEYPSIAIEGFMREQKWTQLTTEPTPGF